MEIKNLILQIESQKEFEIIDITERIRELISDSKIQNGFTNIFSKHTTLSIKINENEPLLIEDITAFMKNIVDEEGNYHHDIISLRTDCPSNEPKNAKGHLRTLILESSQTIPIIDNKLELGKYQKVFAIETSGPRQRQILVQIIGEK
jgi:secondary thiamine-phosphate synthase enzyme